MDEKSGKMLCYQSLCIVFLMIPTNPAGLIEYRAHPFWVQKYCPSHEHDNTPRCCSCERMEPRETGYIGLNDGRKLCLECLDSAIMDTKLNAYEYINLSKLTNLALQGKKFFSVFFFCLCVCYMILFMNTILFYLFRLLTGSILAHEMMHAWLRLKGYRTLSQNVEEGIYQVMAYMWLHSELTSASASSSSSTSRKGKRPPFEMKLGEFFKHQIESDISPVYGDGFRAGHQAVQKYGLQKTLNHIWMTGTFPF
ncbi:protein DA1-related 1-like [Arachis ipaensis]|uniref:protein DA1-related 1-like n=1 Tax=Arachis ipaensis TaxID=130454 RepID=UPI000A2B0E5B|nr:protein DA1-related 1-like [Arachis ipaensis]